MSVVEMDRDVPNQYGSVRIALKDMRGDSVILKEFEDGSIDADDLKRLESTGYKHPLIQCGCGQLAGAKDQDRVEVYESTSGDSPYYFGVFDGHGLTATAADLCADELRTTILDIESSIRAEERNETGEDEDEDADKFAVPSDEAIIQGFHLLDDKIKEMKTKDPRTGTCAVVLMIGKMRRGPSSNDSIDSSDTSGGYDSVAKVAWAGDSRCIMIDEDDKVVELTEDHRVDTHEGEQNRIENTNNPPRNGLEETDFWKDLVTQAEKDGETENLKRNSFLGARRKGGPKVLFAYSGGISLQISRSLGDAMAARSAIATPEIKTVKSENGFGKVRFVLASDGLWDVLTNEAVAKFLKKYSDPQVASAKLCQFAKTKRTYKGLYPDDISVIVVDVNSDKDTQRSTMGRKNKACKVM